MTMASPLNSTKVSCLCLLILCAAVGTVCAGEVDTTLAVKNDAPKPLPIDTPTFMWAQDQWSVFLTFMVNRLRDVEFDITPKWIQFKCVGEHPDTPSRDSQYEATLWFAHDVIPSNSSGPFISNDKTQVTFRLGKKFLEYYWRSFLRFDKSGPYTQFMSQDAVRWVTLDTGYYEELEDDYYEDLNETLIHDLTSENFDQFMADNDVVVVNFYMPINPYSLQMRRRYEEASHLLEGIVPLARVDCAHWLDLAMKYDIDKYPKFLIFRRGDPWHEFWFDWTTQGLETQVMKYLPKADVPELKDVQATEEITSLENLGDEGNAFLGLFPSVDSEGYKTYETVVRRLQTWVRLNRPRQAWEHMIQEYTNMTTFGFSSSREVMSKYGIDPSAGGVAIVRHFDEGVNTIQTTDTEELIQFFEHHAQGALSPKKSAYGEYAKEREIPILWVFTDIDQLKADTDPFMLDTRKLAHEYRGRVKFSFADAMPESQARFVYGPMGFDFQPVEEGKHVIVLENEKRDPYNRYYMPEDPASITSIRKMIDGFLAGTERYWLRAHPEYPEGREELYERREGGRPKNRGIMEATGRTFKELVQPDPDHDRYVLVGLYAHWCPTAKNFTEHHEELARKLEASGAIKRIDLVQIDIVDNDVPAEFEFEYFKFPVFYLTKPGDRENPIRYKSVPSLKGVKRFLRRELDDPELFKTVSE